MSRYLTMLYISSTLKAKVGIENGSMEFGIVWLYLLGPMVFPVVD